MFEFLKRGFWIARREATRRAKELEKIEQQNAGFIDSLPPGPNLIRGYNQIKSMLEAMRDLDPHMEISRSEYSFSGMVDQIVHLRIQGRLSEFEGGVIYGACGLHRYIVRSDGTISFSAYHSGENMVEKARSLVFPIEGELRSTSQPRVPPDAPHFS